MLLSDMNVSLAVVSGSGAGLHSLLWDKRARQTSSHWERSPIRRLQVALVHLGRKTRNVFSILLTLTKTSGCGTWAALGMEDGAWGCSCQGGLKKKTKKNKSQITEICLQIPHQRRPFIYVCARTSTTLPQPLHNSKRSLVFVEAERDGTWCCMAGDSSRWCRREAVQVRTRGTQKHTRTDWI